VSYLDCMRRLSSDNVPTQVVLVDECTSGVDPLSRRALWRTLTSFRDDRAIVFTTHVCSYLLSYFLLSHGASSS